MKVFTLNFVVLNKKKGWSQPDKPA